MAAGSTGAITTSQFYVNFDGLDRKMIKSVTEISFTGQVTGSEKPLASTKDGQTLRQATSGGYQEYPNLTIEVYLSEGDMDFYNWFIGVAPANYGGNAGSKWSENRKNGSVVAYAPDGKTVVMQWDIKNAWIKSYKVSDFDVQSKELAFETFEIVCEDIVRTK
jgi:phage tail-like protein